MTKWIYRFSSTSANLPHINSVDQLCNIMKDNLQNLLGNKGVTLAQMFGQKLPIPHGLIISTKLYHYYQQNNDSLPSDFISDLKSSILDLEHQTGKNFGDHNNPLLVAVRSSAAVSMPGIMNTILNLGINDIIVEGLSAITGNRIFALDTYMRFIQTYGQVVMGVSPSEFELALNQFKTLNNITSQEQLTQEHLHNLITIFKQIIHKETKQEFPQDVNIQLHQAIQAVLKSWMNQHAITYRKLNNISGNIGTAIIVQTMVFGNMGNDSATGVVFTRNPLTGDNKLYGEFLINAQGDNVVSGASIPNSILSDNKDQKCTLKYAMPKMYEELLQHCKQLEQHYCNIQDIEFTIEKQKLYILQTRSAKCTALATIKALVDMVASGLITKKEAIAKINPMSLNQLLHSYIDESENYKVITQGLPSTPGAVTGVIALSVAAAEKLSNQHHKVIFICSNISPEDIKAMHISSGILTTGGNTTSHAAILSRALGKPHICAAKDVIIDQQNGLIKIRDISLHQGSKITIDGNSGKVFVGEVRLLQPEFSKECQLFMEWADEIKTVEVKANADTSDDVKLALRLGATSIGLCRTEHMLLEDNKISLVQETIIADNDKCRLNALEKLFCCIKLILKELFAATTQTPINIRLLDAPLHEFLPTTFTTAHNRIIDNLNISQETFNARINTLKEVNPMLGHRGCRIGISFPEIYEMQVRAIFEAAAEILLELKVMPKIEVTIPLISHKKELQLLKRIIYKIVEKVEQQKLLKYRCKFDYTIGTMIELPRAALQAYELAQEVDFFCFGTNDLTQTTYGISRDDSTSFINQYIENDIFTADPFTTLDCEAVGELIQIAIERGRTAKKHLKIGICGEHAADLNSVEFFHKVKVDSISCSPYKIPIARLAAAQAALKNN
ncbi:pyruvate, phosphate dikinase [Orientia tsutsugamushi str. Gilliam]|uniref:Pyruvate, phosphate dikinase n=1 Tax=Orientia tsutsugamushi str. Gilliam TaxID=1359184 RepID=A0A0F3M447_ORITS|nr:pyruvate, phosphate dikinase [Orientia tsutsugamushi]KJV50525.1 pyruvate, phosphate dikinase [Orientia tsutsugamushi str. Gilliam]